MIEDFMLGKYRHCISQLETKKKEVEFSLSALQNKADISVCKICYLRCEQDDQETSRSVVDEIHRLLTTTRSLPTKSQVLFLELMLLYNLLLVRCTSIKLDDDIDAISEENNRLLYESFQRVSELVNKKRKQSIRRKLVQDQDVINCLEYLVQKESLLKVHKLTTPIVLVCVIWCFNQINLKNLEVAKKGIDLLNRFSLQDKKIPAPLDHVLLAPLPPSIIKLSSDRDDSDTGFVTLQELVHFMSAIADYRCCENQSFHNNISKISFTDWVPYSTLLKVVVLYNEHKYSDVIEICQKILYIDDIAILNKVKAYLLIILGSSQAKQNQRHLAVESFKEALKADFTSYISMYLLSQQYQALSLYDAEINILECLMQCLEEENETRENNTVQHLVCLLESPVITVPQVLWILSSRCMELGRYADAADHYLDLIARITDPSFIFKQTRDHEDDCNLFLKECSIVLPNITTIYKDTCYSLLKSHQYEQCIVVCDTALSSFTSQDTQETSRQDSEEEILLSPDNDEFDELFDCDERVSKKRPRSSSSNHNIDPRWQDLYQHISFQFYKADAFLGLNNLANAADTLHKVIETLQEFPTTDPVWRANTFPGSGQTLGPQLKKRRTGLTSKQTAGDEEHSHVSAAFNDWETLMCTACTKLFKVLSSENKFHDALHFMRLALQLDKDNTAIWFDLVTNLVNCRQDGEGYKLWLEHRCIDLRADSFHLGSILRSRKNQLSQIQANTDDNSDEKYLTLDVTALSFIMKNR